MKKEKQINMGPAPHGTGAFTLVKLIVVITILVILGTIAFIFLQGYSKDARDSSRISDIEPVLDWTLIDTNCDISNIHVPVGCTEGTTGCQIWAGCNSTLGTGIEYGKKDDGGNGTIGSCYKNYSGTDNISDCIIGSTAMASNTKANTWFTGTNSNGDSEVANIWGKYYVWLEASKIDGTGPCRNGYKLPSDEDWYNLEVALGSTDRSTTGDYSGIRDGWYSNGLGWKLNNSKSTDNNMVKALKLPLSGYRDYDEVTFIGRGGATFLWSSTPNATNATNVYFMVLSQNDSTVIRSSYIQSYGYSVRCLKH